MATRKTKRGSKRARTDTAPDEVVAVTGALGFIGRRLLQALEDDTRVTRVIALDARPPEALFEKDGAAADPRTSMQLYGKVSFHPLDLTEARAGAELEEILARERVTRVCHLAFLSNPTHAVEAAHELESVGTMYVLLAAERAGVRRVVGLSSTMTYGARPDNPAWLTEGHALRGAGSSAFVDDKVDADQQLMRFAERNTDVATAVVRLGAMLGGSRTRNFWTRYFTRPLITTVLGYDPLFQFLHADDAVRGIAAVLLSDVTGAFNLVGRGVLPLHEVIRRLGRRALPVPYQTGTFALGTLWNAQLVEVPPGFLDYLRWTWVCDGKKLEDAIGFRAEHDIASVLRAVREEFR